MDSSGEVFSRMWSRRPSPSAVVLWVKEPPAAILSCRVDSLLRPSQKCCNNTWLGIDKFWLDLDRIEKLSQATPMDSFSFCWKLRISCCRAVIQDIGKNARHNVSFPTLWAYHCFALSSSEKGNNFNWSVSCDMSEMIRQA
jgi:hypothetical protein